jgi:N-acetylglucosamine-6-phosphate deacetylase
VVEGMTLYFTDRIKAVTDEYPSADTEVIDAKGAYVSPGFIDMHIHGSGGADVMDATLDAMHTIASVLPQTGTTSFLATTMTMSQAQIEKSLDSIAEAMGRKMGAVVLGAHLEGPFINPKKHGAQDSRYIQLPTWEWLEPYEDTVRMITLAPEVEGGTAFVKMLRKRFPHMVLSIGHSEADYEEALTAFEVGISHVTHLFNTMRPYHHREPGIVGACFDTPEVSCDIIADLIHTHPHHLRLVYRMKKDALILITDAMRAGCMRSGSYTLGGQRVNVQDGKALLPDGTLAGSVLQMNQALKKMVDTTPMDVGEAVESVTRLPAQKLGLSKGRLVEGYDADIVVFDEDFSIISTFISGECIYQRRR